MKKFITFLVVLTTFLSTSYGQGGSVKGTVKDADGLALIGATVQVENTNTAVVTDLDGNYTLNGVPADATLVYSYVGMESQTIAAGGKGVIDVVLASDSSELEEVIIIGYGTTTKRKSVGAVSSIDSEKVAATTYPDIQSALQGQVPGLFVTSTGSNMNSSPSVSIRGGGEPLYVIDGVISSATEFGMLNPSDVETMSFLKDASATAVYGSKAGNGIILVQTKRGEVGAAKITYNGSFQISEPTVIADRTTTRQFMTMVNDVKMREEGVVYYQPEEFDQIGKNYLYPDNHWPNMIFRDWGFQQKHNLGISGGTEDTKYYAALGTFSNNGMIAAGLESMNRTNFRTNIVSKIDKINLTMNASMDASLMETEQMPHQNYRGMYYQTPPNTVAQNPDGTPTPIQENPMSYFTEDNKGYVNNDKVYLNAKMDLTWAPKSVKGLSAGFMAAYKNQSNFNRTWNAYGDLYSWDDENNVGVNQGSGNTISLTASPNYWRYVDLEARVAYTKTFGKHTFDGLLLYTQRTTTSDSVSASRTGYTSTIMDQIDGGPLTGQSTSGTATMGGQQGLVFRAKYDYADKYILEFSGRYDGNDDFAEGYRWGFFPSASAVWIMSDEEFMQSLNDKNIINFMKVRGSYGQTGVSDSKYRFDYISAYSTGNTYYIDGAYQSTYQEGPLVDPANLSWYTRTSTNFGVDLGFANNKFQASVDYFYYKTTGFLANPQDEYDVTLGTSFPAVVSDTEHRREGFEFLLTYQNKFGDFDVTLSANVSKFNQLYAWDDRENPADQMNPYIRTTQRTDAAEVAHQTNGYFTSMEQLFNTPRYYKYTNQEFGDLVYVDANGDGQITDDDQRFLDSPSSAHFNYGLNFMVAWKNLSLSGLLQGVGTRTTFIGENINGCYVRDSNLACQMDYWSEDNLDARFPITSSSKQNNNYTVSDIYFENARYFRLKNLALSYNLKNSVLQNVSFIEGLSVSLSGTNLLTWSPFKYLADPESDIPSPSDDKTKGQTTTTTSHSPAYRSFALGINLTF